MPDLETQPGKQPKKFPSGLREKCQESRERNRQITKLRETTRDIGRQGDSERYRESEREKKDTKIAREKCGSTRERDRGIERF